MDADKLQDLKDIAYRNVDAESHAVFLATVVWKSIPQNIKDKLTKNEKGEILLDDTKVLEILKDILPKFIAEDEFKARLETAINDKRADMQELYDILTLESINEVTKETGVTLIAEAETEEEVKDTTKDLTDILNKDAVPNILKAIASKVQGEVKKSNEQLEKIEETETSLINTASGDGDDDNSIYNDNPDDDTSNGSQDAGDTSSTSDGDTVSNPDDTEGSIEDNNKEGQTQNQDDGEGETPKEEPDDKSAIGGEDGELYTESVRVKYATELYKNFVYRIKNSVSKYVYASLADGQEVNEATKAFLAVATYGIITLGYLLDDFGIYEIGEFAKRCEDVLSYKATGEGDL